MPVNNSLSLQWRSYENYVTSLQRNAFQQPRTITDIAVAQLNEIAEIFTVELPLLKGYHLKCARLYSD